MCTGKSVKTAIGVFALIAVLLLIGPGAQYRAWGDSPDYRQLRLFRQVMEIVKKNYVKEVTDKELIEGAINGMLQGLDHHSSYLTEDLFRELKVDTEAEFEGLGIEIVIDNGILTIVSPIEDTPAYRAGLKAGDKIVKIDGETTKNISLLQAVKKMRGPKGTKVTLTIMRKGFRKMKDFEIVRDEIHVWSVKAQMLEKGYPYIRITSFAETTTDDLLDKIRELGGEEGIKGMVLDLRNNPGGLLDQAVKVANVFIDKGLIVYTDGRVKDQRMDFSASPTGKHYNFKLAVLINNGSASASEIVAGAMQDHNRALIFGQKSFGKASVQTIIPLETGAGLRLTTAYYYTPNGRHIQKKGIAPDVDLEEEIDKQQEAEFQKRKKEKDKDSLRSRFRKPKADPEKDIALKRALEWLKTDVTVKQFKERLKDDKGETVQDTAWYMKN